MKFFSGKIKKENNYKTLYYDYLLDFAKGSYNADNGVGGKNAVLVDTYEKDIPILFTIEKFSPWEGQYSVLYINKGRLKNMKYDNKKQVNIYNKEKVFITIMKDNQTGEVYILHDLLSYGADAGTQEKHILKISKNKIELYKYFTIASVRPRDGEAGERNYFYQIDGKDVEKEVYDSEWYDFASKIDTENLVNLEPIELTKEKIQNILVL